MLVWSAMTRLLRGGTENSNILPVRTSLAPPLAYPAFCKQQMQEHVEHDATLKQLDMPVDINAHGKLLDDLRGNQVENLAHILKLANNAGFQLDLVVHNSVQLRVVQKSTA